MVWRIEFAPAAARQLKKMAPGISARLLDYLAQRLDGCKDPRHFGEALTANFAGLWRYRIGDYRVICQIKEDAVVVVVLNIGHRREVYKK